MKTKTTKQTAFATPKLWKVKPEVFEAAQVLVKKQIDSLETENDKLHKESYEAIQRARDAEFLVIRLTEALAKMSKGWKKYTLEA